MVPFKTIKQREKEAITEALSLTSGNKTRAAGLLGVSIKTLYNKLHEYGMNEDLIRKTQSRVENDVKPDVNSDNNNDVVTILKD